MSSITHFIDTNYHHFNAGALKRAAGEYKSFVEGGGKMMVTLAGAMSTAELGISLAEMIRQGKVHAISCTGANLEEDLFNAVAHNHYHKIPNYRDLSPEDEEQLLAEHKNRVTDTCIPEEEAMRHLEEYLVPLWKAGHKVGGRFPHEYMYEVVLNPEFQKLFQIPRENSWILAAAEKKLPIFVPGWEDSTLGNFAVSHTIKSGVEMSAFKTGMHYMRELIHWYKSTCKDPIGFFQIGGGIAGDFPICVVPLIHQDLEEDVPVWQYFCQITDAQESYGGYSGALPNEKITWGKLRAVTPKFVIHSDATIVAPLMFSYVLGH
jgi:deoxyhypusine synthase